MKFFRTLYFYGPQISSPLCSKSAKLYNMSLKSPDQVLFPAISHHHVVSLKYDMPSQGFPILLNTEGYVDYRSIIIDFSTKFD